VPPRRSDPVQQPPPADLKGIPTSAPTGTRWYREHGFRSGVTDGGCWYFAPLPTDPDDGGRFDVPAPEGTCYFGNRERVAALERVGRFTAERKAVPADLVEGRVVTTIETGELPSKVVNLLARRAATHFGVTGELFTMSDHAMGQVWAAAIGAAGHHGLIYTPRFSPGEKAIAVFGPQGPHPQPVVSHRTLRDVLKAAKVPITPVPTSTGITFKSPPTPKPPRRRSKPSS
jgi:hypothetical protein